MLIGRKFSIEVWFLGHCKAIGCNEVSDKFLNESSDLAECRELQKRNRTFKTEANGLTLKEILDQYLNMNKLSELIFTNYYIDF